MVTSEFCGYTKLLKIAIIVLFVSDCRLSQSSGSVGMQIVEEQFSDFQLTMKVLGILLRENIQFTEIFIICPEKHFNLLRNFQFGEHIWLFAIKSCQNTSVDLSLANIFNNENQNYIMRGHALVVVHLECSQQMKFSPASQSEIFFKNFICLIFSKSEDLVPLQKPQAISKHPFLTGIIKEDLIVDIFENSIPTGELKLISNFKYSINATSGTIVRNSMDTTQALSEGSSSNFQKLMLRVAAVKAETYAYDTNITRESVIVSTNSSANATKSVVFSYHDSFAIDVLRALEFTMNFTVSLRVTAAWGHLDKNRTWVGMIPLLLQDEVDLAISSTASLPFRRSVVDFNMPTNEIRLTAFFRQPRSTSQRSALIEPFKWDFWLATFIWLILASLTMIFFKRILSSYGCLDLIEIEQLWNVADCFQWAIGSVCLQGFYNIPQVCCFRWVIGIGYLSGMLIYTVYAGTLISFLSVIVEPIKSIEQLLDTHFVFSVEDSPLPQKFLAESPNAHVKRIYERLRPEPIYEDMTMAAKELTKGSFVFIVNHLTGYESLNHDFLIDDACAVREMIIKNGEQKQGSMVNKNATFKRTIDFQILRMHEYGLVKKWTNKYLQKRPKCEKKQSYEGVDFKSVAMSFLGLLIGATLTTIILILEVIRAPSKTSARNWILTNIWRQIRSPFEFELERRNNTSPVRARKTSRQKNIFTP